MPGDAVPAGYALRAAMGRHYFWHLRNFVGGNLEDTLWFLEQDATVALPRNAHLGHSGFPPPAEGPLAVDLSSRRLRLARWLLDGVRQGQSLGALLGYRFERRLHERGLDRESPYFRNLAPLVAGKLEATELPAERIAANTVVDGLGLFEKWDRDPTQVSAARRRRALRGDRRGLLKAEARTGK